MSQKITYNNLKSGMTNKASKSTVDLPNKM